MFSLYDHKRIPGGKKIISWDRCVFDSVSIVSKKEMSWYCSYFGLFPSFTIWEENKRCRAFSFVPVNFTRRHKPAASTNFRNWLRAFFFNFFGGGLSWAEPRKENVYVLFFWYCLNLLYCFVFVFLLYILGCYPRSMSMSMAKKKSMHVHVFLFGDSLLFRVCLPSLWSRQYE